MTPKDACWHQLLTLLRDLLERDYQRYQDEQGRRARQKGSVRAGKGART